MIIMKIAVTVFVLGLVGLLFNMVTAKDPSDFRNHLYSTIPTVLSGVTIVMYIVWFG